ncbi:BON domain-containing protein [Oligoflexus tunisiensis]|uniref:BON domain-containing protein n=1 Tax=Oligoflexus tunisiensis TaxID=708132 RepID=UPI00159EFF01|nr:BON domain-containing protein [Oligoflexus tunisiensis]
MKRKIAIVLAGVACLSLSIAEAENKFVTIMTSAPEGRSALSAEHQSNADADITITRRIRQAVVKDDTLSLYAQNVKIITIDGHVVLKGPVRTEAERALVEQYALDVAGPEHVESELQVVP